MRSNGVLGWVLAAVGVGAIGAVLMTAAAIFIVPTAIFGVVAWRFLDVFEEHGERMERVADRQMDAMGEMREGDGFDGPDRPADPVDAAERAEFDARFRQALRDFDETKVKADRDQNEARRAFDARFRRTSELIEKAEREQEARRRAFDDEFRRAKAKIERGG